NCEDSKEEMLRRTRPILDYYGASFSDIARDLHAFSLAGQDAILAAFDDRDMITPTPLYARILAIAQDIRPIFIGLDNVADVFAGNEISRTQVRQFLTLMRQLAIAAHGFVLLSSHPSLTGLKSESGLSGSTQWHNGVRARAWLKTITAKDGSEP